MRKTKIICTIGPASKDYDTMKKLALNGMDIMRLNFSHAHPELIEAGIRRLGRAIKRQLAQEQP